MSGLYGAREPEWEYLLLDRHGYTKKTLETVTAHNIELAATERLGGNATIELGSSEEIDFLNDRVRFIYNPGVDGEQPWPVGTFLLSSPKQQMGAAKKGLTIECLHLPAVVDRYHVTTPITVAKGENIVSRVVELLKQTGLPVAATPSSEVAGEARTFDVKESLLTTVNDLLTSIGYWAVFVDALGTCQVHPWTPPADRPTDWTFETGDRVALHKPDWTREQNLSGIVNRVVCATTGTDTEPAIVGVAENNDTDNPFSIPNRGVVSKSYDVEAASQAAANSLAKMYLDRNQDPVLRVEVEHAIVPVSPNSVVELDVGGTLEKFTVQRMSVSSGLGSQVKSVWRGVTGRELYETDGDTNQS